MEISENFFFILHLEINKCGIGPVVRRITAYLDYPPGFQMSSTNVEKDNEQPQKTEER